MKPATWQCNHAKNRSAPQKRSTIRMIGIPRLGENAKHLNLEAVNPELFSPKVIPNRCALGTLVASLSGRAILTEGKIVPSRMAKVFSQLAQRSHARQK